MEKDKNMQPDGRCIGPGYCHKCIWNGATKQMSRSISTSNFQKTSLLSRSRSIWQKWRKAFAVLLTNPSDIKQKTNSWLFSLTKIFNETINSVIFSNCLWRRDQRKDSPNLNHLKYVPVLKKTYNAMQF
jgi:hypothetical protein